MPTRRTSMLVAAVSALVATLVGTAYATGPGFSELLMAIGAVTALVLVRSEEGPRP